MSDLNNIGSVVTGGIVARTVDRLGHSAGADGHDQSGDCANCGAMLTGTYCATCGQHGHVHRTMMALVHDILHGVFHFEGRTWNTLPMLAWRPGELTRRYAQGERVKFVSPMALFLFSVFIMFAVTASLTKNMDFGTFARAKPETGLIAEYQYQAARLTKAERRLAKPIDTTDAEDSEDRAAAVVKRDKARAQIAQLTAAATALKIEPARLRTPPKAEKAMNPIEHAAENPALVAYKMKSYAYKYSWALIPISLPFIWLLFPLRRDVGLYDHAIFATYSLSFMLLMATTLAALYFLWIPQWILWTAFAVIPPIHMYRQLKGAYQLSNTAAFWRMCVLLTMTTVTASLFFAMLIYLGSAE
ncbi:DUF3667 domain-containing protein [Sphingomonas montanisoli]|uniref:DUF3667 domain-containing protein n=1 Tax=Sphingomonas montanisoli TaxID=2606412 RepID=A0A5D9C160_9SPHN|nr:DUF3667 domain-containing protein [Sphingomonas montanisoli]TZG24927.1 DUF3667 domain-containing protein [Sphingomonas montanisoli]